jgi:hypothetical protein
MSMLSHWIGFERHPRIRERLAREGLDASALVRSSDEFGVSVATILDRAAMRGVRREAERVITYWLGGEW